MVSFSRPGYGHTRVGPLSVAGFSPLVREVCEERGISSIAAAVGVSFGGLAGSARVAADQQLSVPRLVLHSCAPSGLPYPDSRTEAILGPVVFSAPLQALVWRLVRRMVRSDAGLRLMLARLSTLPVREWWPDRTAGHRTEARVVLLDALGLRLRQRPQPRAKGRGGATGRDPRIPCPTLVTASRHGGGVAFGRGGRHRP